MGMRLHSLPVLGLLVAASLPGVAFGELTLPGVFSDGLILQREKGARIWGWAEEGQKVTVTFAEQSDEAIAGADGRWEVILMNLTASAEGRVLEVTSGGKSRSIRDVLVGEVWLASGQSNMEWRVENSDGADEAIAASADPLLRVFQTPNIAKGELQRNLEGRWTSAGVETTGSFPAVGYYFAHRLREELAMPVAIIECAWGGKPVESFISSEALQELPEAQAIITRKEKAVAGWQPERANAKFEKALARWEVTKEGRRPSMPVNPAKNPRYHSTIYQGMIAPLVGFSLRGVIWYQGEANVGPATAPHYGELLSAMVADWRTRWQDSFPFYYAQLASFQEASDEPGLESGWVTVQDEMRRALTTIPKSGMAVLNDLGDAKDIHPGNKHEVGARLARYALVHDYGKAGVVTSGPLYTGAEVSGGRMLISFEHGQGLKSRDGAALKRFEIRAQDGAWQWAEKVEILGERVAVSASGIEEPFAVRYAWSPNPAGANLVNGAGLPASVFTTGEGD